MAVRRWAGLAAVVIAAVIVASCSETAGGTPTTANSPERSTVHKSAPPSGNANVPTVDNPLDASALKADPCNALSAQQVEQLGLKPGSNGSTTAGPVCEYEYTDVLGNAVSIMITEKFDEGLADIYKRKDELGYFKETTVAGYPAVYAGQYDDRNKGRCMLHVGLTNNFVPAVFTALDGGSDRSRPCDVVKMTAEAMIKNLKGGA